MRRKKSTEGAASRRVEEGRRGREGTEGAAGRRVEDGHREDERDFGLSEMVGQFSPYNDRQQPKDPGWPTRSVPTGEGDGRLLSGRDRRGRSAAPAAAGSVAKCRQGTFGNENSSNEVLVFARRLDGRLDGVEVGGDDDRAFDRFGEIGNEEEDEEDDWKLRARKAPNYRRK
uniref:Uncharacterized protein n=1 Tax=Globodera pallida TaxID=36090 RepID=A0A183BMP8_GLOPA